MSQGPRKSDRPPNGLRSRTRSGPRPDGLLRLLSGRQRTEHDAGDQCKGDADDDGNVDGLSPCFADREPVRQKVTPSVALRVEVPDLHVSVMTIDTHSGQSSNESQFRIAPAKDPSSSALAVSKPYRCETSQEARQVACCSSPAPVSYRMGNKAR
jgi:hypothetical protein